jgi:DNA-directed RNA polymerase specialized sigma24 family protein
VTLSPDVALAADDACLDVLAVHEALERLEQVDDRWAAVVEMRFFAGLTSEETAAGLGLSEPAVRRVWNRARMWLAREMSG